jgi:hypothetical protein
LAGKEGKRGVQETGPEMELDRIQSMGLGQHIKSQDGAFGEEEAGRSQFAVASRKATG